MADDIQLRVTAKDDASKTLDEVIAKGEAINAQPAVVEIVAVDEAGPVLAKDLAEAEALDATPVVIETTVVGTAEEQLAALSTEVEALQAQVAVLETELAGLGAAGTEAAVGVKATESAAVGAGASLAAVGAVVAGAGVAIGKTVTMFQNLALKAKDFATASGTSVQSASRWIEVSDDLGVSVEGVQSAIGRMNKNIGAGKIDLAAYGVTATDTDSRFLGLIEHLHGINDASKQAAQGAAIFGKSWQVLAPLITNATTLKERFDDVGASKIVDPQGAADARAFADDLDNLKDEAEGLALELGKTFVPFLDAIGQVAGPVAKLASGLVTARQEAQKKADSKGASWIDQTIGFLTQTGPEAFKFWVNGLDKATGGTGDRFKEITKFTGDWGEVIDSNGHKLLNLSESCVDVTGKTEQQIEAIKAADVAMTDESAAADALGQKLQNLARAHDAGAEAQTAFTSTFTAGLRDGLNTHTTYALIEDDLGNLTEDLTKAGSEFKKTGDHVTTFSADGRKVLGDIDKLGTAIGTNLGQVLKDSGGNYDDVRQKAEDYRQQLIAEATAAGASADSIQGYIELLHLTPTQVETTIRLAKEEEARQKLLLLQSTLASLPKDTQLEIQQEILAGDYVGALKTVQDYATAHPAKTELDLGTTLSQSAYDNWKSNVQAPGNAPVVSLAVSTTEAGATISRFIREESGGTITLFTQVVNPDGTISRSNVKFKMAGGYVDQPGVYDVGEAGRERVFLPRGAEVASAGRVMQMDARATPYEVHYHVTVNASPLTNPAEIGAATVNAIKAYERRSGKSWRAA